MRTPHRVYASTRERVKPNQKKIPKHQKPKIPTKTKTKTMASAKTRQVHQTDMCVDCIGWIRKVATFVSPLLSNGLGSNSFWTLSDRKRVETVYDQSILARVKAFHLIVKDGIGFQLDCSHTPFNHRPATRRLSNSSGWSNWVTDSMPKSWSASSC